MISHIHNRPYLLPSSLHFTGKKSKPKPQSQLAPEHPALPITPAVTQLPPQMAIRQPVEGIAEEINPALSAEDESAHREPLEEDAQTLELNDLNDLDLVDKSELSETDYARQQALEEKAMFEAIGRRFAIPGRALNRAENYAKSWSRTLIEKTSSAIRQTKQVVRKKTADTLRTWANALASEQE